MLKNFLKLKQQIYYPANQNVVRDWRRINFTNNKIDEQKIMRPERLELPTFRSGVGRATNCAKAPIVHTGDPSCPINSDTYKRLYLRFAQRHNL